MRISEKITQTTLNLEGNERLINLHGLLNEFLYIAAKPDNKGKRVESSIFGLHREEVEEMSTLLAPAFIGASHNGEDIICYQLDNEGNDPIYLVKVGYQNGFFITNEKPSNLA